MKEWCFKKQKTKWRKHYNLYTDGLIIQTTIDSRLQKHAFMLRKKWQNYKKNFINTGKDFQTTIPKRF